MNERVEYTYAYFMHIINVWASGVSPPQPPHFFVGVSSLEQCNSCTCGRTTKSVSFQFMIKEVGECHNIWTADLQIKPDHVQYNSVLYIQ